MFFFFFKQKTAYEMRISDWSSDVCSFRSLPNPAFAQGATFDAAGALWISASTGKGGHLYKLDTRDGHILATYDAMAGIEDLAHDAQGRLWAVAEAGSQRWSAWATFFPLLFAIDPAALPRP